MSVSLRVVHVSNISPHMHRGEHMQLCFYAPMSIQVSLSYGHVGAI